MYVLLSAYVGVRLETRGPCTSLALDLNNTTTFHTFSFILTPNLINGLPLSIAQMLVPPLHG